MLQNSKHKTIRVFFSFYVNKDIYNTYVTEICILSMMTYIFVMHEETHSIYLKPWSVR